MLLLLVVCPASIVRIDKHNVWVHPLEADLLLPTDFPATPPAALTAFAAPRHIHQLLLLKRRPHSCPGLLIKLAQRMDPAVQLLHAVELGVCPTAAELLQNLQQRGPLELHADPNGLQEGPAAAVWIWELQDGKLEVLKQAYEAAGDVALEHEATGQGCAAAAGGDLRHTACTSIQVHT
jgi:hypothetical protein